MNDIFRELYFDQRKNFEIVERLKKEREKNKELLDELIEEEKIGEFVSDEYKEQLESAESFFQKIIGENNE